MYISHLDQGEIWDLSHFSRADILSFGYLHLRSLVYLEKFGSEMVIQNPSFDFRRSIARMKWDLGSVVPSWKAIFPQLLPEQQEDGRATGSKFLEIPGLENRVQFEWQQDGEILGVGFPNSPEGMEGMFPKLLDFLIAKRMGRTYLRIPRQSFYYIPKIGEQSKTGLFVQEKDDFGFPDFYLYWVTPSN